MAGRVFELNDKTLSIIEEIGGHMPGGFFIYQAAPPENLIYVNKATLDIFGCATLEEFKALTGYTFKGMVYSEDYEQITSSIEAQIDESSDKMDYAEYRIIRRDGKLRWVDDYGHYTETDKYGGIYVVFISDITEKRARREEDAAVRNAVIASLTNAYNTVWLINDVVSEQCSLYHTDMDAIHEEAIRNALSHAKYTDTKTQYVDTMIAPEDRERLQVQMGLPYILEQFETRDRFSVTFLRELETGERYYRIDFGKMHMPGGKIGVTMGFIDVDDEVRRDYATQQQIIEQERRRKELDSMITAMASDYRSVYHVDLDLNDAVCYRADKIDESLTPEGVHFNYSEWIEKYCELYVDDEYRHGFLSFADADSIRLALSNQSIVAYRYLARRDGNEYYEMLRMAGVRHPNDRDDHTVHAIGLGFTDIDDEMRDAMAKNHALSEALNAAEQANKAKTAFLSNMSHEIRTPMNAIIGLNNIALNEPDISQRLREYLTKIGASAQHLLGIINDILDMSRIESGRMTIKHEEFSFAKCIEQVNTMVSGQCRDKGLNFECVTVGKVDDYYIGDAMKLKQVMINILGNAVKFTPEGGTVRFVIEEGKRYDKKAVLKLIFSDTGIGMSKDYLPYLFEPFSQEDSSSTNKYGSTGLGMPITKSIVELMNGSIEVDSVKGEGTTFTVCVTLGESDRKSSNGDDGEFDPHEMRVLVIDDDQIALEHAKIVLGQIGISCDTADSGQMGVDMARLRHARQEDYDLLLIDWRMPDMDGIETTRQIRAFAGHDTPIIILTSFNWDDIADEAKAAGVDTFVPKPLFAGSVLDEFREAFKRKNEALSQARAELAGKRVLLAEDVAINAEIMLMVLSMREINAELAENGKIALDMYLEKPEGYYDAILMDMRMPVMDGLEATRHIRASGKADAGSIPIIALTANAFDEDVQRSLQAGLNAHLSKPVEPEALFDTLERLIDD